LAAKIETTLSYGETPESLCNLSLNRYHVVTDRQTDRQTDIITIGSTRLAPRAVERKNEKNVKMRKSKRTCETFIERLVKVNECFFSWKTVKIGAGKSTKSERLCSTLDECATINS